MKYYSFNCWVLQTPLMYGFLMSYYNIFSRKSVFWDRLNDLLSWGSVQNLIAIPSASTSLIMSCSSASVGFWPSDLMTVPSSLVVMVPSPSLSNKENASLNSVIMRCFIKKLSWDKHLNLERNFTDAELRNARLH